MASELFLRRALSLTSWLDNEVNVRLWVMDIGVRSSGLMVMQEGDSYAAWMEGNRSIWLFANPNHPDVADLRQSYKFMLGVPLDL